MRRTNQTRFKSFNFSNDVFNRRRRKGLIAIYPGTGAILMGAHDLCLFGKAAFFKNFRPAKTKPAIAHNKAILTAAKLPRDSFHAKSAATRYQNGCLSFVSFF